MCKVLLLRYLIVVLVLLAPVIAPSAIAQDNRSSAVQTRISEPDISTKAIPRMRMSQAEPKRAPTLLKSEPVKPRPSIPGFDWPKSRPTSCNFCCPQEGGCCLDCEPFQDSSNTAAEKAAPQTAPPPKTAAAICSLPPLAKTISATELLHLRAMSREPAVAKCLAATRTLLPRRAEVEAAQTEDARKIGKEYVDACFSEEVLINQSDLTITEAHQLRANLVFLVSPDDADKRVQCHGFRIGQVVLTALHCLRDNAARPVPMAVRTVDTPQLLETEEILPNDGGQLEADRVPNRDVALLRIKNSAAPVDDRGIDWLAEPNNNARLITMQSNIYVRNAMNLDGPIDLSPTLRIEHRPACRLAMARDDGFLLHSCSTEQGTSGMPLFQRHPDGRIRLIGVHTGATEGLHGYPDLLACRDQAENRGVRSPINDLRAAIERSGLGR